MRELAVQAANDTLTADDRDAIKTEVDALTTEIDRISNTTQFNTKVLLDGSFSGTFHIGANADQNLSVTIATMSAAALSVSSSDISVTTWASANAAITTISSAIAAVSTERSKLGAVQNRLEHTIANLQVAAENLTASESRIRDVDLAAEMVNFTKTQILQQAGTAILAQANQAPQSVLSLLR